MTYPPGCSFCGKAAADVRKIISGPGIYTCDGCVSDRVDRRRVAGGRLRGHLDHGYRDQGDPAQAAEAGRRRTFP
ncbi:ClpX C4-type zinc finger protein [Saccharothrix deserti]|uniref:ClpX C4-type zinc finger protein n=1 Tax=Saccharothrix deserti TaxID=2593674 RepID=UPI00131C075F|nr:ClpX C4-type zinc finger protein [Saccharothrix deserti]